MRLHICFCSNGQQAGTIAQQAISNIRTVAAYNGQDGALTAYTRSLDATLKSGFKTGAISGSAMGELTRKMQ